VYRRIGVAPEAVTRGLGRARQTALLRRSRLIVAVAEAVRRETVETFRVPRERVVVIPRGIDPGRLRPERGGTAVREELGIAPGRPVLISLGALSPEKAPLAHLDLLAALLPAVPEAVYLFAGDGPMRGELEEAVRSRGFGEHVRMLGSRADVGDLLDASDLLVLPSELEGMPGCVIEAGMVGVPVVAYGVAGVPEVVVDGVTGSVVAPGDREALAARALELLADEGRRRDLGRAAMERCRSLFDIHLIADRYAEVYAGAVRSAVEDGRQRERTRTLRRRRRAA
jgi:glycosyltransferase involved in cell wall biosynthesis